MLIRHGTSELVSRPRGKARRQGGDVLIDIRWLRDVALPLIFLTRDYLQAKWRKAFAARNILVLGGKQTGKSSLMLFLRSGHPYEVTDGDLKPPAPTAMAAIVDCKFSPNKAEWLRLRKDVPGDRDLRATWKQAIADIRPHGIIYLIDGRQETADLVRDVRDIQSDVLSHYTGGVGHLVALHVFLGFSDQWAADPMTIRRRCRVVEDALLQIVESSTSEPSDGFRTSRDGLGPAKLDLPRRESPLFNHLRIHVSETQLSPARKSWTEVERALARFAADLVG